MKWENTILNDKQVDKIANKIKASDYKTSVEYWETILLAVRTKQAEISFKAGQEEEYKKP